MWSRWLGVVATAMISLSPAVAVGEQVVVVLHAAGGKPHHRGVERELRRRGLTIAPPALGSGATVARRKAAAHAVETAIAAGRERYLAQDYPPAIAQLESVEVDYLAALLPTRQGRALLGSINLWLGALHAAAGDRDRALDRFALAVAVDPDAQLDASVWPPASVQLFEEAGRQPRPVATLSIVTAESVRIALDGEARWRDGGEVQRVPAGRHYVLIRWLGHEAIARVVELRAGLVETVEVELDVAGVIRGLARASGASRVIVVGSRHLALHDASGRELARVSGGRTDAAVDTLVTQGRLVPVAPAAERDPPVYARWWFWTAIGVGVAAAGAGVVYVTTRDDGPLRGRFTP